MYSLKRHFGFRNNQSTEHVLVSLVELKKKYLDNGYFACGVIIDLQKGFNTNQNILLAKLEHYGINNWSRSVDTRSVCDNDRSVLLQCKKCFMWYSERINTRPPIIFCTC